MVAGGAAAQDKGAHSEQVYTYERFTEEKNRQNFRGWRGLLFHCANDEPESQAASKICDKAFVDAEFLAATANVPLRKASAGYEVGYTAVVGNLLILEVNVFATKNDNPAAIHASVLAYTSYSEAVQKLRDNDPRAAPRRGDLVLWQRKIIGASAGRADDLVPAISDGIEMHLKEFFAEFIRARRRQRK